jgi:outer membrane immunogenic protein
MRKKVLLWAIAFAVLSFGNQAMAGPPVYNWTGFYVGAEGGYGFGETSTKFNPLPTAASFFSLKPQYLHPDPMGGFGGGTLGFNYQASPAIVFGVEGDFSWADLSGIKHVSPIEDIGGSTEFGMLTAKEVTNWFGTARVRVGVTPMDRLLLYITGGLAVSQVRYSALTLYTGNPGYPASATKVLPGWVVGAGGEWAFCDNWSLKAEALHYELGDQTLVANEQASGPYQVGYKFSTGITALRVGVNYKFW